jgi:hypothetical protein
LTLEGQVLAPNLTTGCSRAYRRLLFPRSPSNSGKVLVSVDLAEIRHTPRSPSAHRKGSVSLKAKIEMLEAEIARLVPPTVQTLSASTSVPTA